jgi:cyclic dehypoxanthinyl futalosine synthase
MTERDDSTPAPAGDDAPWRSGPEARTLLDACRRRRLAGGELLLLLEEAALDELEHAAAGLRPPHGGSDRVVDLDVPPSRDVTDCEAVLRETKVACPGARLRGLSPPAIHRLAGASGLQTLEVLRRLAGAGLDCLGGDGTALLCERVQRLVAPDGIAPRRWIEICEEAHYLGLSSTADMACGPLETYPERIELLLRLRDSQERTRGYEAFVLVPHRPDAAALDPAACREPSADRRRTLALARLALDNFPPPHPGESAG